MNMRASPKTTKTNAAHNNGRAIRVTKYNQQGNIIASAEVSTLEAAHRFLDSLNPDGTMKAPAKPSKPIPAPSSPTLGEALMQATPKQQQQACARPVACGTCGGLQWVPDADLRPQPCRACHGSGKARQ
jgi:DnaJ-class molecular chaperone